MVNAWHDIATGEEAPKFVTAIVENPRDSNTKYELDKQTGMLRLDRHLFSAVYYPADYGFIPQTYCDDKDPLDVFILTMRPTYPMTICDVQVIGMIHMVDGGEEDDKIIAVHKNDPRFKEWNDISDVPQHILKELKHFLETYKLLEEKEVEVFEVQNAEAAFKTIEEAQKLYAETFKK